jgi:multidrug efflux system membrane fusion protein
MKRLRLFGSVTLVIALVLGGIWALVAARHHQQTARDLAKTSALDKSVPVDMAAAKTADVPVYVDGIGTVQALTTVSIHPMVDGPLVAVRFHEGQDVKAGDVLAQIDPRTYQATLDQALGKKAQDEANLRNALLDLGRYEKLAKTQYTTAQQADTQRATVQQDQALITQDQAQIDSARTNLSYTTITAPASGRTGIRQVDQGNIVHSADTTPITVVTTLRPIDVVFTLPQQTLPDVVQAMAAGKPDVLALPQNGDSNAVIDHGFLRVLDNEVDQTTGTIKLKAQFPNTNLKLWPGAFVNVRLALRTDRGVITVPIAAIQRGPAAAFLYVVDASNVAHRREVVVAHQDETIAVVSSGLKPGEQVITDGASRVTDGAHVRRQVAVAG